ISWGSAMKELAVGTFDETKTNTVTLVNLGEQIAAFMDGQIVYTILSARGMGTGVQNTFAAGGTIACEFDNYKLWDLSGLDLNPSSTAAPSNTNDWGVIIHIANENQYCQLYIEDEGSIAVVADPGTTAYYDTRSGTRRYTMYYQNCDSNDPNDSQGIGSVTFTHTITDPVTWVIDSKLSPP
ncbi:hypothetical protein ACFLXB_00820, partial [Chloroflexota bacterium]